MFQAFWPTADKATNPVAGPINSLPKHVFSSTIDDASWGQHEPAIIERGEGAKTVRELKERYSGNLIVWGSLTLTESLFRAKLVDVVRLRIAPVLLGSGRPSAPGADTALRLVGTQTFPAGQVTLELTDRCSSA